jgi:glyoxylase-like metal-dependent hydrolase (beta-lactamase superfamily II)
MNEKIEVIKLGFVNAFLMSVRDGFVLIDSGTAGQWGKLEGRLTAAGCLPDKLRLVIATHGDFDHTGNCARLQRQYRAPIAMHEADAFMVEKGVMVDRIVRTFLGKLMILIAKWGNRRTPFDRFKPDVLLADGQDMLAYGLPGRVIHIPGHTKGSVAVLTDEGSLIVGDTVANMRKPALPLFVDDPEELKKSIDKLKRLAVQMVYPGHGTPFPAEAMVKVEPL